MRRIILTEWRISHCLIVTAVAMKKVEMCFVMQSISYFRVRKSEWFWFCFGVLNLLLVTNQYTCRNKFVPVSYSAK